MNHLQHPEVSDRIILRPVGNYSDEQLIKFVQTFGYHVNSIVVGTELITAIGALKASRLVGFNGSRVFNDGNLQGASLNWPKAVCFVKSKTPLF